MAVAPAACALGMSVVRIQSAPWLLSSRGLRQLGMRLCSSATSSQGNATVIIAHGQNFEYSRASRCFKMLTSPIRAPHVRSRSARVAPAAREGHGHRGAQLAHEDSQQADCRPYPPDYVVRTCLLRAAYAHVTEMLAKMLTLRWKAVRSTLRSYDVDPPLVLLVQYVTCELSP